MPVTNPTAEQRDGLAFLYVNYGSKPFQQNDVRDYISRSMFRKFCDRNYIVKAGMCKLVAERKNGNGTNVHYVNNWRLDKKCVERYVV
jgi:hypothetical protein